MSTKRILTLLLCFAMCLVSLSSCSSCVSQKKDKTDALVIMSDELDGLFNPFYSTTAPDGTIVAMTQISMLTTGYENGEVVVAFGDDQAVVVKDYAIRRDEINDKTVYTFVIKNGITFSDGKPLTINDVLFNLYVYLDPVYTGSSTMYSTDILGLTSYRTQQQVADDSDSGDSLSAQANEYAQIRVNELLNVYLSVKNQSAVGEVSQADMQAAIMNWSLNDMYKEAISKNPATVNNTQLLADYNRTLELFREELKTDYASAKEAYLEEPYKSTGEFDELTSFMYHEGYVKLEYAKDPITNKDIKSQITKVIREYGSSAVYDQESAINFVFNDKISTALDEILQWWATANELRVEYAAKATEVILSKTMKDDGSLAVPNIKGIVSLGHTDLAGTQVTATNGTYTVASAHNADGTVVNPNEYDVLQITINGVDPKAIWNFAFSVAPQHYYAQGYTVDIVNNQFGVEFGSFDFMTQVIQNPAVTKVPMGAGAYKATDKNNADNPSGTSFYSDNVVYFKRNDSFLLGTPKIEKIRYKVVSSSNALSALQNGEVHYVTPQLTQNNIDILKGLEKSGIQSTYTDQLGYGYIGINAGKVPDIELRKAIMCAMDTSLALSYYQTGTASTIFWPMSKVSWAYPKGNDAQINGHEYPAPVFNKERAKQQIIDYMEIANVAAGDKKLSIKFTIAGSNLTDHPTYQTFQNAADLLNECGWDIEVVPDTLALTKLSTGSLAVWAAAWGSTIDPDMYQVYHKNSTATSTLAWGYREILASPGQYQEETYILNQLSDKIDEARETEDRIIRTALYQEAMSYVLDLAIELPVYQRSVLYAYNSNIIDVSTLPAKESLNPYTSPLDHIWEIGFAFEK